MKYLVRRRTFSFIFEFERKTSTLLCMCVCVHVCVCVCDWVIGKQGKQHNINVYLCTTDYWGHKQHFIQIMICLLIIFRPQTLPMKCSRFRLDMSFCFKSITVVTVNQTDQAMLLIWQQMSLTCLFSALHRNITERWII